jgi:hypothetical protein
MGAKYAMWITEKALKSLIPMGISHPLILHENRSKSKARAQEGSNPGKRPSIRDLPMITARNKQKQGLCPAIACRVSFKDSPSYLLARE